MASIKAYYAGWYEIAAQRAKGKTFEEAVRAVATPVIVPEGHPAYPYLNIGILGVVDGNMYGKTVECILGD